LPAVSARLCCQVSSTKAGRARRKVVPSSSQRKTTGSRHCTLQQIWQRSLSKRAGDKSDQSPRHVPHPQHRGHAEHPRSIGSFVDQKWQKIQTVTRNTNQIINGCVDSNMLPVV
jgi:hypothetical protein